MSPKSLCVFLTALFAISAWSLADEAAPIAKHERWITSIAFSPNGEILATGGGQSLQYRAGDIKLWDAKSGNELGELLGHEANVWSIAFSGDGSKLVSASYNGQVILWDVAQRKPIATLDKHKSWVRSVAFSGDNLLFATAGEDGNVTIWAVDGAKEVKTIKAHETQVTCVAFAPDGKTLATASTDKTAKLWDVESAAEKAKLEGHEDSVWSVVYAKDGSRIATAGADRKIMLWDASGKSQAALHGHKDWVSQVAFSSDGKSLASSSLDWTVKIWNLETAIQLAGPVAEAVKKVADTRKAIDDASQQIADAQKQSDEIKEKVAAVNLIVAEKDAAEKSTAAQAALDADKENAEKKKAVEDAKAAADKATKDADEKIKVFASNKEFTDLLTKLKGAAKDEAIAEKSKMDKESEVLTAKVAEGEAKKGEVEKSLDGVLAERQKLYDQQSTTLSGYKSTVWSAAFSLDGQTLATGSQRVGAESRTNTIRVWKIADNTEVFPAPVAAPAATPDKEGEKKAE